MDRIAQYRELLLAWNRKVNLIGPEAVRNLDEHIAEAVEAAGLLRPSGAVLDFGSGGGLPAIPMAILQAVGQIAIFNSYNASGVPLIEGFGSNALITITVITTMTAGTMFAVWLGDLITEQGIGNGISIIIFSGIVASAPANFAQLMSTSTQPVYNAILFIIIVLVTTVTIVVIQEGVRRVPVQYGKRVRGRKQYGGASTHIPMRVNPVGLTMLPSITMRRLPAVL